MGAAMNLIAGVQVGVAVFSIASHRAALSIAIACASAAVCVLMAIKVDR